ncbi:MAG: hypothetical protein NXI17_01025 [Alphaproteobacteria bacterium]|nr:hypothetical protein [Alphaproteobacteria bacterium]
MDNQNLFSQSYDQITKQILGTGNNYFQMLGNPQSFNWPVAASGQLAPEAYQLMSAAPVYSPVATFGGVGTSTLFDNYRQIFGHVGFNNSPEIEQQIKDLSDNVTAAQNEVTKTWTNANTAYLTAKQNGGVIFEAQYPSIAEWMAGPGSNYATEAETWTKKADAILKQIQSLNAANQPTELSDALALMARPTSSPSAGDAPRGWTKVANGAGVLEWQPSFTISTSSQSWRQELTKGTIGEKSITLDASKSDSSITKSWAGANVSYGTPFWGVYASGKWSETNITKSDNSVTATVKLQSATNVLITPGAWYNGGFLKQMANAGTQGTGYSILQPYSSTGGDHPLFGANGICSTMVTGLVVAYKPSFSITMKSSTYKSFEQSISASAGLRIGPFSFGGSGGHYQHDVSTTGNSTTVTGGSTSDDPVILGVTVGFPGTEKP